MANTNTACRSALFVPATRAERIPKALASGADVVIVDLEDAVAEDDKQQARDSLERAAGQQPAGALWVRINAPASAHFEADLALCKRLPGLAGLVVAKAESAEALARAAATGLPLWPLIESATGLARLAEIAGAPGVERLTFGALDMALDLGLESATPGAEKVLDLLRGQLVLHSRLAGLAPPLAGVHPAIDDSDALSRAAVEARQMGFGGMLCIHPRQLGPIHAAFTPSEEQLEWARRVVERATSGEAAFRLDGEMVDAPVIERARRLLTRTDA